MKVTIDHEIRISLPAGAARAVMHVLLSPRNGPGQTVGEWKVELPPEANPVSFSDGFGNRAMLAAHAKPPEEWVVRAVGEVETEDRNGVLGRVPGDPVPRLYLRQTELTPPLPELVVPFEDRARGRDRIGLLHALMTTAPKVIRNKSPKRSAQSQTQSADGQTQSQSQVQTLTPPPSSARPTPPELAHTFIGAARALGIPARYVTGYLARESATAPAMHAWAEAYDDGLGWIGFDPLLQLCPTDRHVRVAVGLDANSASPLRSSPVPSAVPTPKLTIQWAPSQPKK